MRIYVSLYLCGSLVTILVLCLRALSRSSYPAIARLIPLSHRQVCSLWYVPLLAFLLPVTPLGLPDADDPLTLVIAGSINVVQSHVSLPIFNIALVISSIILLVFLIKYLICFLLCVRIPAMSTNDDGAFMNPLREACRQVELCESRVHVRLCATTSTPFAFGIHTRFIVIPRDLVAACSRSELALILRHELSHIRRGDLIMKAVAFVVCAVFWANPLVWIMQRCIAHDLELACDEQVIDELPRRRRKDYAMLLIRLSMRASSTPSIVNCAIVDRRSDMYRRIRAVIDAKKRSGNLRYLAVLYALAVLVISFPIDPPVM